MDKKKRVNTYTNKEYFKLIALAKTKEQSFSFSKLISLDKEHQRGVFYSSFQKTQLVVFPRFVSKLDHQATTVAVEGLILYLESKEDYEEIKTILSRYNQVPIRIVVSNFDASEIAKEINGSWMQLTEDPRELIDHINQLDMVEFNKIRDSFEQYDTDGSGSIDAKEMCDIARSLGEDPESEEFRKSLYALDLNQDGVISLKEFITWWKIGRQNGHALPKIYDLFVGVQDLLKTTFNLDNYSEMITKTSDEQVKAQSKQNIVFRSTGQYQIKSRLELSLAVGSEKRQEMAVNFLSQFTKNTASAKANWLSILIPLNKKNRKIDPSKAKFLLDEFKEHCLKWGEENMGSAFTSFFKNLLVFETNNSENSVILAARLKIDIEELVKNAVQSITYILNSLQPDKSSTTWFNFKANSNVDLYDASLADMHLGEFLDTCEVFIEGSTFREQFKSLFSSFSQEYQEKLAWLQIFFQPNNLEVELDCKLSDFSFGKEKKSFINSFCLKKVGKFLDFLKKSIPNELLISAENIEICLNAFDIFARFKLFTKNTFSEDIKI